MNERFLKTVQAWGSVVAIVIAILSMGWTSAKSQAALAHAVDELGEKLPTLIEANRKLSTENKSSIEVLKNQQANDAIRLNAMLDELIRIREAVER